MVTVKELLEILKHCDEDMPVVLEVDKGVFKELKGLTQEDTDIGYHVALSIYSIYEN